MISGKSTFPFGNKVARLAWQVAWLLFVRWTPRPCHGWRRAVYRLFGARLGRRCHLYAGAKVWAPWTLECGDDACIADGAEVYNPAGATIGARAVISQEAFLCGATHDYEKADFPLATARIVVGEDAWVAARSVVLPGATVGEGSVVGAGSVVTKETAPWTVNAGNPSRMIKERRREHSR
jgi:putative colanic acid biosynthesis acetyltransferase WcaF